MNKYRDFKMFYLLATVAAMLFFQQAAAQEDNPAQVQTSDEGKRNTQSKKSIPEERVFKPSEEISDDSPVPFPVDI